MRSIHEPFQGALREGTDSSLEVTSFSRRRFLRDCSVICTLTGVGLAVGNCSVNTVEVGSRPFDFFKRPPAVVLSGDASEIANRLLSYFDYLRLDEAGLTAFTSAFVKHRDARELDASMPFLTLEERYLLSSSFFEDGMDEGTPVKFVRFYDPYIRPCSNPLSSMAGS